MEEIWKDIKGYEGLYQVSTLGRVKSLNKIIVDKNGKERKYPERIMSQQKFRTGYFGVKLYRNNTNKRKLVSRLVALTFIPNPNNFPYINHINGIKTDNRVENLEWCTPSYNVQHAWSKGLNIMDTKRLNKNRNNGMKTAKKVEQYSKDNKKIQEFNSLREAERITRIRYDHISECCKGTAKTAGGYLWKYKD